MSKFAELLAQLNAEQEAQEGLLAKSLPSQSDTDDKTIQNAAKEGEGGEDDDEGREEVSAVGGGEGDGEGEGEGELAKSLTLANGETVIDATELLKSLQETQDQHDEVLAKALPQVLQLVQGQSKMIQQQGDLLKSMQARIDQLAGQGRGRKTVVSVVEKQSVGETLAKSQQEGLTPQEFMLKASSAFDKGVITGLQLSTIDVSIREGQSIDPNLIQKIVNS